MANNKINESRDEVTILFAGDSGDGIQLTGSQFTSTTALFGNDLSTFPNFPAEIRAPQGTLAGVSGFKLNFGSNEVYTPGDNCDVLVAMNAAALRSKLDQLKPGGVIIANSAGFDARNLKLAGYGENEDPLKAASGKFKVYQIDLTKMTRECLADTRLGTKEKDRCKNMFVLGFLYWMYDRSLDHTIDFISEKFAKIPDVKEANIKVLKAGYHFGDTSETFTTRYKVKAAKLSKGEYRNITGNEATAIGLIAASKKSGLNLFYGSYPITPASDILHELSKHKNFGVKTFQAEDEIAAICASIGASFGGELGITASSGPGIALKGEAIGLAIMLELPLIICNIQRGGPSTGLPTKTEQADLLQAVYGRNGEAPLPVVSASTPADCFWMIYEACRIAVEHMTPVIFLSDGYLANGSEPWKFPKASEIPAIKAKFAKELQSAGERYLPYKRDARLVREWAVPGTKGLEHRIGGLEKENETGNVSYDPANHELMVKIRAEKISKIAEFIPKQRVDQGPESGGLLLLSWGSTYGAVKSAVKESLAEGIDVSHVHLNYLNPFPINLGNILKGFDKVLIPEMNDGQLIKLIRDEYLINAEGLNKIQGVPFTKTEIKSKILALTRASVI